MEANRGVVFIKATQAGAFVNFFAASFNKRIVWHNYPTQIIYDQQQKHNSNTHVLYIDRVKYQIFAKHLF